MSARSVAPAAPAFLAALAFTIGFVAAAPKVLAQAPPAQGAPAGGAQQPAGGAPQGRGGGGRGGGRGGFGGPVGPARTTAPVDLTGTWVSVVTEDWRWRMMTPPKGDVAGIPANASARQVADAWDPSREGSCDAYGVGGLMRMPARFRISWQDDNTLKIESDAGQQTRLLHFAAPGAQALTSVGQQRTLQGYSIAEWQRSGGALDAFGPGLGPEAAGLGAQQRWGSLKVVTTNMLPGWLLRNGVPYGQNATITEYFTRFTNKDAGDWFVITTVIDDPQFLTQQWITSTNFKKEPNDSKWAPSACKAS